jgi:hypothetical protein
MRSRAAVNKDRTSRPPGPPAALLQQCNPPAAGFMTEGILAAVKFRNLDGGPRVLAIQNHGWIQVAATLSTALGFGAIYRNKALKGKKHFTSLHGKVGGYCWPTSGLQCSSCLP